MSDHGASPARARPTLLFIPGWGFEPRCLESLIERLRGTFETTLLAADPAYGELSRRLRESPSEVLLAGWSLGGMLAIEAASRQPRRVAGLLLSGSTARFCSGGDFPFGVEEAKIRVLMRGLCKDPVGTLERFHRDCALPHEPIVLPEGERAFPEVEILLRGLEYLRSTDLREAWMGLDMPRTVLHGLEDRIISWRAGDWLARSSARVRWRPVEDAGHDLPLRRPDLVLRALEDLMDELT